MNRPFDSVRGALGVAFASLALLGAQTAMAGLVSDSYAIGSNPGNGEYQAGVALKNQLAGLTTPGFANGGYTGGSGTSNFVATAGGLDYAPFGSPGPNDGKVSWVSAGADGVNRSVGRNLTAVATSSSYWFSVLVSQSGTTSFTSPDSFVLGGFSNTVAPSLNTTGTSQGLYFGFSQDGSANNSGNLVIRSRIAATNTTADTVLLSGLGGGTARVFNIIARLDVNAGTGGDPASTDYLTYWVNPTDYSSVATLDSTSLVTNDLTGRVATNALQNAAGFTRVTYTATNWTGTANFDEMRLGTSLSDIAPVTSAVPEPASIAMLGLGLVGGLGYASRRRRTLSV